MTDAVATVPAAPAAPATGAAAPSSAIPAVQPAAAPAPSPSPPAPAAGKTNGTAEPAKADGPPKPLIGGEEATEPAKDAAKPDGEAAKPEDAKPIEYDIKLPEGVEADEQLLGQAKEIFGTAKLSQDQAQAMVDFWQTQAPKMAEALQKSNYQTWYDQQKTWQKQIMTDPEVGGEKFPASKAAVDTAIRRTLGKDAGTFFDALIVTGASNHPAVFKGLLKMLRTRSEGAPVTGQPMTQEPKSMAQRLYNSGQKG